MSVFVSGATGFIAQHIVKQLLDQGYEVIGTVRSQSKADHLSKLFNNNPKLSLELVSDISDLNAFDKVFEKRGKEIKYVLHTASPFHFNTTEFEKDLLIPAVNGTKGILESIKKYAADNVERVVITSSFAAILDLTKVNQENVVYTEKDWNPATWEGAQANALFAYCGSKAFAEKAAWEFLQNNKDQVKFKLSTVNPVYVFGPQAFAEEVKDTLNTSNELINQVYKSSADAKLPLGKMGEFIDVRDVAKAHVLAFQKENTVGKRLLMAAGVFGQQDIANVLNKDFPKLNGKIAASNPDTDVALGKAPININAKATEEILGFKYIDFETSIRDTVAQIIEFRKD